MKKFVCISTEKFCNLILALLGVEGENEGFINEGKLKRLCFIVKNNFERIDFSKFAELHNLGIEGEFGKEDDKISGFIDVRLDSQVNFLGETLFEVPEDKIIALVKMLISERFVTQTDNIVGVARRSFRPPDSRAARTSRRRRRHRGRGLRCGGPRPPSP